MKRMQPTPELIAQVRKRYPTEPTAQLAQSLGLKIGRLYQIANSRGIKKSPDFMKETRFKVCQTPESKASRFTKGQPAVNKGKKMRPDVREKVKHTFFPSGHKPHNTKMDGDIVQRHDKTGKVYQYIRLAKAKWALLHRVMWEQANGKIPKGYICAFKDGNSLNCELQNLQLITRQQSIERNRITAYPAEIREIVKLKNKLNKAINNKQNNHGTE